MIIVLVILMYVVIKFLNNYTNHSETYVVQDFTNLKINEITNNPLNKVFRFVIIDSIYDNKKEKGVVVSQSPLPNSKVKKNRKIYLTIVASQPEKIICPNLEDLTIRQAINMLETYDFVVGRVEYVPDIGNTVIRWKHKGKEISLGDKLIRGSRIDLVVGSGDKNEKTFIPNLANMTRKEALSEIGRASCRERVCLYV